jgi:hypothetical protein
MLPTLPNWDNRSHKRLLLVHYINHSAKHFPSLRHFGGHVIVVVVPAVMYREPEYATVGLLGKDMAAKAGVEVDVYCARLEHNDWAILERDNVVFCNFFCLKGTGTIVGATIIAARVGEIINEVTLAMKHNIRLDGIGLNIHAYPILQEKLSWDMACSLSIPNGQNWNINLFFKIYILEPLWIA